MLVDQHDAILAPERGTGRAYVHARRLFAVLAEQWQGLGMPGLPVLQGDLADPLGIGLRTAESGQAVFVVAGLDTVGAAISALVGIDQHAPTDSAGNRFISRFCMSDGMQQHTGCDTQAGYGCGGPAEKTPSVTIEIGIFTHGSTPRQQASGR